MPTRTRTTLDVVCGHCSTPLRPGTLVQLFGFPGLARPKLRCRACATEPPPAVIDTTPPPPPPPAPDGRQHRLFSAHDLARDFKRRQSGD